MARVAESDHLEVHVLDRLRHLEERASLPPELQAMRVETEEMRQRLESANERVLRRLRHRISSGRYTPAGLRRAFARRAGPPGQQDGYDALDLLAAGLLGAGAPAEERAAREPEMVAYQPTPARAILALIERANLGPEDLLYDLGSGLGQVVILAALLCRARARGVEIEPAYCEYAERSARQLNVPGVEFIQGDAREVSLAGGTVYFLYTPFRGALLRRVLERLEAEARARPIRVCTYGPGTAEVAATGWPRPAQDRELSGHEVAVFTPPGG